MHKEEKSFVKEKKTSSNSSRKSDKKKVQIHQVLVPNLHQITLEKIEHGKKALENTLLMSSLRDGNPIETLLMTAQINSDFVNHFMPLTTETSTSLGRVGTDACESKILRYKDYDSHKNAHEDFQKRFVDNPFGHGCSICDRLWFRDYLSTPVTEHKIFYRELI
ncbi:uncharacterized protein TNCV_1786181 [Trichonephila clavipes]|nr:uncharacterized protein TNCV_1786181 [Trichonephila clavipes]